MVATMLTKQIAGGYLRNAELSHQALRLGAFADARRAEQKDRAGEKVARVREWFRHIERQQK
jgi:hypothetical protein